jgi:acyl-CoA synthetase (AMP-forming)/AMP-acid ligase II
MTLQVLVEQVEHRLGDRVGIIEGDEQLTYGDLIGLGRAMVRRIAASVGEQQPRVAAVMDNRWEYLALDAGLAAVGGVLVRCNSRDAADDIAYVLRDSGCHAVVHSAELSPLLDAALGRLEHSPLRITLPPSGAGDRRDAFARLGQEADEFSPPPDVRGTDVYRLMYTSGTTGTPKGVVVTHDQWRAAVLEHLFLGPLRDLGPGARLLHVTPLSHVAGGLFWPFMLAGAVQVVAPTADVATAAALVEQHGITHTFLVPTLVQRLLSLDDAGQQGLATLQRVYYAASPIDPAVLREAVARFGPIFAQGYGSTEAMWWLTYLEPAEHAAALAADDLRRLTSCGRPSTGIELRLVDDEGRPVATGELGEVATRGRHVARSYWGLGEVPLDEGGWFRTGDLGFADSEGYVHLMDRKSDLIVSGGFNVYPREVELALSAHPAVAQCCVVGAPDQDWGEIVAAVVVLEPGANADVGDLLSFGREVLAGYKRPRRVDVADALPLTSNGKTDRKAVRATYWTGRARTI